MNDKEFIKRFLAIHISDICEELNINKTNVYNLTASSKKLKLVRDILEKEIRGLLDESK